MCVRERSTAVSFIFCLIRLLRALALFPLYGLATVVGFAVVVVVATAVFFVIIGTSLLVLFVTAVALRRITEVGVSEQIKTIISLLLVP